MELTFSKIKSLLESPVVYFQASVNLIQNLENQLFFQLTNGVKKIHFLLVQKPKEKSPESDRQDGFGGNVETDFDSKLLVFYY